VALGELALGHARAGGLGERAGGLDLVGLEDAGAVVGDHQRVRDHAARVGHRREQRRLRARLEAAGQRELARLGGAERERRGGLEGLGERGDVVEREPLAVRRLRLGGGDHRAAAALVDREHDRGRGAQLGTRLAHERPRKSLGALGLVGDGEQTRDGADGAPGAATARRLIR
jgi:hypothetical protein